MSFRRASGWLLISCSVAASAQEPAASVDCSSPLDCSHRLEERSEQVARPADDAQVVALSKALARMGPAALAPLRLLLRDDRPAVRTGAARALRELGPLARAAVPDLIEALQRGTAEASTVLGLTGDPEAVPALTSALVRPGGTSAALALTRLGRPGFEALGSAFDLDGMSESVAATLLEAFREGGAGVETAVRGLEHGLSDPARPSYVRAYAAVCLGQTGPAGLEAAPELRVLLKDPNPTVQQAALDSLSELGDRVVVPELLERRRAVDWTTRVAAFTDLAYLGPGARVAVPQLVGDLKSEDAAQRALAAEALGWIGAQAAVPALTSALDGNSWSAAEEAARALARLGARETIPALHRVAQDHWLPRVRQVAAGAEAELRHAPRKIQRGHDFRDVERARRVRASLPETPRCVESTEGGWHVRQGERERFLRAPDVEDSAPTILPTVLPPIRLGGDAGFKETLRGHTVEQGWLVAQDAGEWGGALWFVGWDGRRTKLLEQAVEGFVDAGPGMIALGTLAHGSRSAGALWTLRRSANRGWRAEPLMELPAAPLAWDVLPEGVLLVVTSAGAVQVGADGRPHELTCTNEGAPAQASLAEERR